MSIGYLVLYAALALVALWLAAELLLQNRAPVAWRALALAGFAGVVAGMRLQSVLVIGAGAAGFAIGQTLVTLSVKRGYTAGWSLRRADGALPGPLARVPLLSAATGGVPDEEAVAEAAPRVGAVGPVEPEQPGATYTEVEELADDGVYTDPAAAGYEQTWTQQPAQQDAYAQQAYAQQLYAQQAYGYGYEQTWTQQPGQSVQQDAYAQQAYAQQLYAQQAYAQAQYTGYAAQQDPYAAQQQVPQQTTEQYWAQQQTQQQAYQQPQPAVPQQTVHQQTWDYQQQG
ncbi:hypothetical protein [Kitasatospora sp. NPDC059571]|uniref:hypothetical protein n=1 Tax=Kitasatospora sp. NPDC059571 TaxID=3346871 RepID=UPI0036D03DA3